MTASDESLDLLERAIQNLKVEFNRFLSGALETAPEGMSEMIRSEIRILHEQTRSTADRFRLRTLEARFITYSEHFNRQLETHQAKRRGPGQAVGKAKNRFIIGNRLERATAESLYQGLYAGSSEGTNVDFETFMSYVESQRDMIRERTGCAEVQFRIAQEDGKRKLKAKPADQGSQETPSKAKK